MINRFKLIYVFLCIVFISCKKEKKTNPITETPTETEKGILKIDFEHVVDAAPLIFNQKYVNPKADTFQVTKFNYFISNIVITKTDNSTFSEPESYHLVLHSSPASKTITLSNVPAGSYKAISFMLGIDSARNCSGAQTGALDPASTAADMYWNWNSGYIMFKLEGSAPKSNAGGKKIEYHVGGYGGVNKSQRNFSFNFGSITANVSKNTSPYVHLTTNVNELFKTPTLIDFTTQSTQVSIGSGAKMYADNYADMIIFKSVQN